jgi:hypothetical protein
MAIQTTDKCCPICGKDVAEPSFKRFGEWTARRPMRKNS